MKAYYIDFYQSELLDVIDIGIGSIPYAQEYHYDMIIVASNRYQAWRMFNAYHTIETHCEGDIHPSTFRDTSDKSRLYSNYDYQGLLFITIDEDCDSGRFERIFPMSGHLLCAVVQHHPKVAYCAKYLFGHGKNLWSNDPTPSTEKPNQPPTEFTIPF